MIITILHVDESSYYFEYRGFLFRRSREDEVVYRKGDSFFLDTSRLPTWIQTN